MKRKVHLVAAVLALLFLAVFWSSTVVAELFLSAAAVATVKQAIAWALLGFVPVMAVTGASGFSMGGKSKHPTITAKRKRMPVIGGIGLLVLAPAAVFLAQRAQAGVFDGVFYGVQALELVAGAVNLVLIGRNFRDGWNMRRRKRSSD
ncbi:hypothetical protein [Xylophilus sp. ASV27]|uniref:hypothetical protein n=1 Tax=Xylophilus sp. ASV27 TaxID=2795129 RepID=UPI001E58D025|nr:hypothetical protein [Xylophilus sp. ASV27]